jgi:hypothetical protein
MGDRSLLQLLLEEAPAEAFEQPVREAVERGADEAEIAGLRADVAVALQIRTILAERRRREAELAALYETAGDLTSLRDVENVLQALVQRARRLMGTDVAYLTLFDEERGARQPWADPPKGPGSSTARWARCPSIGSQCQR